MNIVDFNAFEQRQYLAKNTKEQLSLVKALTTAFSLKGLSVSHETLLPGTRACSRHYYAKKDELVFVLKGSPSVRINGEIIRLKPGEVFGSPTEAGIPYVVVNESNAPAFFLSIGSETNEDEAIYA
ncbi:cupin domain-containing protein [Candidatus Methylobacter oryzae]|uniref:Cupin domain-containing protein n=1 Tax=Candidatus Methylobacter oryzae TaxID=2497749 RepID=A0ABY3CEP6_9GAMM|nr:cupin domain-containing protein [Candidatus Methylobacter oryzae]TRX01604.1 cupin domain-containing protein [Candidatus Methylobacter oryzae]